MDELENKFNDLTITKKERYKDIKLKKKTTVILCRRCGNNVNTELCFCNKVKYYSENVESILKIQRWFKLIILNRITVSKVIDTPLKNNTWYNEPDINEIYDKSPIKNGLK